MKSSSRCIAVSTQSLMPRGPFPSSFLDVYSLSFLGCKGLCIDVSFLVLWCIC